MKKILFLVLGMMLWGEVISVAQQDSLFEDNDTVDFYQLESNIDFLITAKENADKAFLSEDYESAIETYELILAGQVESADVYYNLGNSYYKVSNTAKAILNYERALLLSPGDYDIRFNLELAKSKTVDKVIPINEFFLFTWIKSLIYLESSDSWARIAITIFLFCIFSFLIYLFGTKMFIRKIGFLLAVCFFIMTILFNIFASYQKQQLINRVNGIVMIPSVTVKSTPNENGTDLFILHEGHKIEIKDATMKEWREIRLADGNIGWIPMDAVEII